jgi:hypothetical protein
MNFRMNRSDSSLVMGRKKEKDSTVWAKASLESFFFAQEAVIEAQDEMRRRIFYT